MKIEINGNKIIVEGCEVFGEIKNQNLGMEIFAMRKMQMRK